MEAPLIVFCVVFLVVVLVALVAGSRERYLADNEDLEWIAHIKADHDAHLRARTALASLSGPRYPA
jgi:hypothetical protein